MWHSGCVFGGSGSIDGWQPRGGLLGYGLWWASPVARGKYVGFGSIPLPFSQRNDAQGDVFSVVSQVSCFFLAFCFGLT